MMIVVYGFSFSSDIAPLSCSSITDAPFHEAPARLVRVREATRRYLAILSWITPLSVALICLDMLKSLRHLILTTVDKPW